MQKISIIVPIYNVEKYIRQCLDSVVSQTYRNLELLLIDDGSQDGCGSVCDEYAAADSRIVVIHKENAGVSVARNEGLERAKGEWIMFVDPDDWLERDCCARVMKVADEAGFDVIYFQREENREDGRLSKKFPRFGSQRLNRGDLQKIQFEAIANYIQSCGFESTVPWGKIYRREFLVNNCCRFPVGIKKRQDVLFNLYCLEYLREAYFFDYVGYHYRQSENSICRRYNPDMLRILLDYFHKIVEFVMKFHNGDEYCERMLGVHAIALHRDMRNTLFFNSGGFMPIKQYLEYMKSYYSDPSVKEYIDKPNIKDFRTNKDKLDYILISGKHVYLYYFIWAFLKKVKLICCLSK